MIIDPHVHCRDFGEAHKETIAHALRVAERAGLTAIIDMAANANPPAIGEDVVVARLERARAAESPVEYFLTMGLTADEDQVLRAIETYHKHPRVRAFKLFAGHSTNNMGVVEPADQRRVIRTLVRNGYRDVLMVHCERESLMYTPKRGEPLYDALREKPLLHAFFRPPESETGSIADIKRLCAEEGFSGTLHIAHASVPGGVYVAKHGGGGVTAGVTPHHLLFDYTQMLDDGVLMKMNPPLRPPGMNRELLEMLRSGKVDWVETDHAPHTRQDKHEGLASGVAGLDIWPAFVEWLRKQNFTEQRIREVTFDRANEVFGLGLQPRRCTPDLTMGPQYDNSYRVPL